MDNSITPSANSNAVSVVIPVYNQSHLTRRCLESLAANSRNLKELFVINNASKDDTESVLLTFSGQFGTVRFQVITNTENKGFGRAVNQGLRLCTGSHLVVLNNDTWLMPGWDQALVSVMDTRGVEFVVPYFYERPWLSGPDEMESLAARFVTRNLGRTRVHWAAIMFMISRGAFERLKFAEHGGLFDERFFVTYEDTDLWERARELGMRSLQTATCLIWHHSMASRAAPGSLPPAYEQEGLKLFIDKWGFDPRPRDHTLAARLHRRWRKIKDHWGMF
ncbi:MAG: glycosyltransferase family 2 protein [Bdellovibrionales bacterium]|nr:glycosyltransferase family 2 protein [Bdellovibrionales bacterium]